MTTVCTEFLVTVLLIVLTFAVNISHVLYLIFGKHHQHNRFFRSILVNMSLSSLVIAMWLMPFFYFRTLWSLEAFSCRLWSYLFHIVDGVQLYSFLLLVADTNMISLSFQRVCLGLTWMAPMLTYSPLLWWSSAHDQMNDIPYRPLSFPAPTWILSTIYVCMYLVPIGICLALTGTAIAWPWLFDSYRSCVKASVQRERDEHRENMAELTSLVETVLNFELEPSTSSTLNVGLVLR